MAEMEDVDTTAIDRRLLAFGVGNVLGVGLSVFVRHALPFVALALLFYVPVIVLVAVGLHNERSFLYGGTLTRWILAVSALGILMVNIAAPAVMAAVVDQLRGRRAGLGKSLVRGVARVPAVIGVSLVAGFLLALGVYTYLLPGLMVAAIMWVAVPAAVVEGTGVGASIKRSDRLTNGYRWPILGVVVTLWLVELGLRLAISLPLHDHLATRGEVLGYVLAHLAVSVVMTALTASVTAVGYYSLRVVKEHADLNALARVFD